MTWKELIDENGRAVIPDGVSAIDDNAFKGCTGLTSVVIPKRVKGNYHHLVVLFYSLYY